MEEQIRKPDPVKRERLIEDVSIVEDFTQKEDDDLEKALKESCLEFSENYQKQIIDTYLEETRQRKCKFADLLLHLKKIAFYDPEVKEIYEMLDPMIDYYVSQSVETIELDPVTYDRIFQVIGSLKTDGEVLRSLLIKEENTLC